MQHKLQLSDLFNKINRLKEEESLLLSEMKQFIHYFRVTVPNHLQTAIQGTNTIMRTYLYL